MALHRPTIVGATDLARSRKRLDQLEIAIAKIQDLDYEPDPAMVDEVNLLKRTTVALGIPCLLCDAPVTHHVAVTDPHRTFPRAAVCGRCAGGAEIVS